MLQLLASPQFGLLPAPSFPVVTTTTVISRGHLFDIEMAHKDKPSSRGSDLKMSHKNKPARYAERRPGYMPASSHSKTQPKWRHTPDVSLSAAASAIPALPTDKLPPPVDGQRIPVGRYPALVLNADYTPLSYVPLSLWSWQDTVKAVFREAVTVLAEYDVHVRSPSTEMALPSVIVLKKYVGRQNKGIPCFTRRNLFLRDQFTCQYCQKCLRSTCSRTTTSGRGRAAGRRLENVVACSPCNLRRRPGHGEYSGHEAIDRAELPTWPELHAARRPRKELVGRAIMYEVDGLPIERAAQTTNVWARRLEKWVEGEERPCAA